MTQTITASIEDGVLKPAQPLNLPEHAEVRLTVELRGVGRANGVGCEKRKKAGGLGRTLSDGQTTSRRAIDAR